MSENPTITIQGQVYNLPPLNTGQMRYIAAPLLAKIKELHESGDPSDTFLVIGDHATLLHAALKNEYPKLALEAVESMFFGDLQDAVEKLISLSGSARSKGEVKAPGKRNR